MKSRVVCFCLALTLFASPSYSVNGLPNTGSALVEKLPDHDFRTISTVLWLASLFAIVGGATVGAIGIKYYDIASREAPCGGAPVCSLPHCSVTEYCYFNTS